MATNGANQKGFTPDTVRPWIVLGVALVLILAALFVTHDPTTLMLGCTMLGTEPLARAKKETA